MTCLPQRVSEHKGIGGAVFAGIVSSIFGRNLKSGLGVIGNISIGGAIERALNFNDRVSKLSENGANSVFGDVSTCTVKTFTVKDAGVFNHTGRKNVTTASVY